MRLLFKITEGPVTYAYSDNDRKAVIITEDPSFVTESFKKISLRNLLEDMDLPRVDKMTAAEFSKAMHKACAMLDHTEVEIIRF